MQCGIIPATGAEDELNKTSASFHATTPHPDDCLSEGEKRSDTSELTVAYDDSMCIIIFMHVTKLPHGQSGVIQLAATTIH